MMKNKTPSRDSPWKFFFASALHGTVLPYSAKPILEPF